MFSAMLDGIKTNINKLIAVYEAEKEKNRILGDEIERNRKQIEAQREQIIELEKTIDNLKLTNAFLGKTGDSDDAKKKVEKMIREIDRCISLIEG